MTIRVRLTAWYAGVMFVALLAMGALSYYESVIESRSRASRNADAAKEGAEDESDIGEVTRIVLWCGLPAAALAAGGGWWLMRRALAPVEQLTEAAGKIHESNLREQLPRSGNRDELDRLTEVFNAMTARLDDSFQRIREFTLHASHELKTPLTILRGELETALHEENLNPSQQERVSSQIDEIERLTRIVDGLTLLTKADAGQIKLHVEPLRFDDFVRENYADAQILAQALTIRVELVRCDQTMVVGDRHRLRQLLLNLVDNAIKYNHPHGALTLSLRPVGESAEFQITNTGAGVPVDRQSHVFDRFFRGDASHGNAVEGCGLGLSIAQWIVNAHGGNIVFTSEPDKITTVTVRLPLTPTSSVKPA